MINEKLKYIFSICLLVITHFTWAQPDNLVVIKGILKGDLKGYNKIYMYTRTSNDSAEIKNGQYSFSFPFSKVELKILYPAYIKEMKQIYQPFGILIAEPGIYYVESDITKPMSGSVLRGPEPMLIFKQFNDDQGTAYKKLNYTLADMYGKDWYRFEEKDAVYESIQFSNDSLKKILIVPLIDSLIKKHPDSYATAFVLSGVGRQTASLEKKEQWLSMVSERMKKSEQVKIFSDYIQGLKSSGVGNQVANFLLPDPAGNNIVFEDLKGKYVLIDFWASWCAPCRRSFPHMREVYKTYKSDQFEIYGISIDEDKAAWLKAVAEDNNPWLQSLDTKNVSQSGFAVTAVPATFLIGPDGKILVKEVGFDPNGNSEIEKRLVSLFRKKGMTNNGSEEKNKPAVKVVPMSSIE